MKADPVQDIVLASGNAHKAAEIESWLRGRGLALRIRTAGEYGGMEGCVESADDFEGNARRKVDFLRARVGGGMWVLADDSGLAVDALDGAPGVRSARFAGEGASDQQNWEILLERMRKVRSARQRSARFVCVLALGRAEQAVECFRGECEGTILFHPSGGSGFGYDPVFAPHGYRESFADLGPAVKNRISHRALALKALAGALGCFPTKG